MVGTSFYIGFSDTGVDAIKEWKHIPCVMCFNTTIPDWLSHNYLNIDPRCVGFNHLTLWLLENDYSISSIGEALKKFGEKFNGNNLWIKVCFPFDYDVLFEARPTSFAVEDNYAKNANFKFVLQITSVPIYQQRGNGYEHSTESSDTPQE